MRAKGERPDHSRARAVHRFRTAMTVGSGQHEPLASARWDPLSRAFRLPGEQPRACTTARLRTPSHAQRGSMRPPHESNRGNTQLVTPPTRASTLLDGWPR
jgi:hypothetical protein